MVMAEQPEDSQPVNLVIARGNNFRSRSRERPEKKSTTKAGRSKNRIHKSEKTELREVDDGSDYSDDLERDNNALLMDLQG